MKSPALFVSDATPRARVMPADAAGIDEAARLLRAERIVAFPTETVYGLGADATSDRAVARIYAAKGRPACNPLIAHVASLAAAEAEGVFSQDARRLAAAFWPGPLTLVLPLAPGATVCAAARAGQATVALRIPSHPAALRLIEAAVRPLAAPSANRSGQLSPVTAAHVFDDLWGDIDLILDGGACAVGVESTIIACCEDQPRLLRPGGIPREAIEMALGRQLAQDAAPVPILAPGALASHYAPRTRLRLDAPFLQAGEAGLDFGGCFSACGAVRDLSPARDLHEAAANLFCFLHELDALETACIGVAPIPRSGLGEAINDRLQRAAAPRQFASHNRA